MNHVARVVETSTKGVWVQEISSEEISFCRFTGLQLKEDDVYPCALGDVVKVHPKDKIVLEVKPRSNILIRVRKDKAPQPVLAHVSLVCVMVCFQKSTFPTQFVDRLLVGIKQQNIPVDIIVAKKDLLSEKQENWILRYADYMSEHAQTRVHVVNARDPADANLFMQMLKTDPNKPVIGFVGPSGVGKSTFIQQLTGYKLSTSPVNKKTGKGKHVTTQPQLYAKGNLWLADLPGIKAWYPSSEGLIRYFPELITLAGTLRCDVSGCDHVEIRNPGCLLARMWKFSPSDGAREFTKLRYKSYESILSDSG